MKILLFALAVFSFVQLNAQIDQEHLQIGEKAPEIQSRDQNGMIINSKAILKENRILLVFYRGNWCPHCAKHLAELEKNLIALQEKGVFILVVSPETVEKTKETQEKFGVTYSIVHDESNKIMNDYKVAFDVNPKNVTNYYDKVYELVNEYNGPDNAVLPVPATYLIGKDGLIEYVQYDTDYKKRSDISELLESL